jgi:MFS family permease
MISLSFGVAGLVTLFIWREPIGVYVGAAIMAVAQTFLFPALFALTVDRAPDAERSHAVSTFSMFFDLAFAIGGPMIGLVADVSDRPTGFLVAACVSMVALVSCRRILDGIEHHEPIAELGPRSRR